MLQEGSPKLMPALNPGFEASVPPESGLLQRCSELQVGSCSEQVLDIDQGSGASRRSGRLSPGRAELTAKGSVLVVVEAGSQSRSSSMQSTSEGGVEATSKGPGRLAAESPGDWACLNAFHHEQGICWLRRLHITSNERGHVFHHQSR